MISFFSMLDATKLYNVAVLVSSSYSLTLTLIVMIDTFLCVIDDNMI